MTLSRDSVDFSCIQFSHVYAEISPLRRRPEGFAVALWTASRPHLSLLSFIETNLVGVPFVPKQQYKSINRSVHCEGVKGATADFVCFHCPLVAPAAAKSPACEKDKLCLEDRQSGRAHLARHSIDVGKSSLGGAPAGAQSYWQGRFAACALLTSSFG